MNDSMRLRLVALIGAMEGQRRATHTAGFPMDPSKMLPLADVVLLVAAGEGPGTMLFRYTAHGDVGGDTWHGTVAAAQAQAEEEYGDALGAWVVVPSEVADPHEYAVRYAAERLDSRGDW